jgi:mono/diheme cytochrome c family protein
MRISPSLVLLSSLATAVPSALAQDHGALPELTDSLFARGNAVFHGPAGCASCHGDRGVGTDVAPALGDPKWTRGEGTYEELVKRVVHGVSRRESKSRTPMPMRGWTPTSDADIHAVAAYVWSLSRQRGKPPQPERNE